MRTSFRLARCDSVKHENTSFLAKQDEQTRAMSANDGARHRLSTLPRFDTVNRTRQLRSHPRFAIRESGQDDP